MSKSQTDPWLRLMALVAYVDDSGSSPSEPVYVLGGLVLPSEMWDVFSPDWKAVLNSPPRIEYFKGAEVWDRSKGPFVTLTTGERMAKVEALVDTLITYRPLAISCRVEWAVFKKFRAANRIEPELDDPYFFLFFAIIAQMISLGSKETKFDKVNFVFDNQNAIGNHVQMWYAVFLQRATERVAQHLGSEWPDFGDEKLVMPLQAADMFAWYQRRSALGNLGHESHVRIWERFTKLQFSTLLEYTELLNIANGLSAIAT